jgi:hypothetical protein
MIELKAQPGELRELRATIEIKRVNGTVETYDLVGHADPEKLAEIVAQKRVHGAAGAITGQGSGIVVN